MQDSAGPADRIEASLPASRLRLAEAALVHTPGLRRGRAARIRLADITHVHVRRRPAVPALLLLLPWLVAFLAAAENVWVQYQYRHRPSVTYEAIDVAALILLALLLPAILLFAVRASIDVGTPAAQVTFRLRRLDRWRAGPFRRRLAEAVQRARRRASAPASYAPFTE